MNYEGLTMEGFDRSEQRWVRTAKATLQREENAGRLLHLTAEKVGAAGFKFIGRSDWFDWYGRQHAELPKWFTAA